MLAGDVVDEFLNDDRLADAGATEEPDLAALQKWLDQIDDLDAGLEHFFAGGLLIERRCLAMDRPALLVADGTKLIHWLADHVHDATERFAADGHRDGTAKIDSLHAAHHAVGRLHGDAAHTALAEVLLDFENHIDRRGNHKPIADDPSAW